MECDYCQDIANKISLYRNKDRKNGSLSIEINRDHVERWISQFPDNQEIILQETAHLLDEYYFTKEDIEKYLKGIYTSEKIWGENILDAISNTCFLDFQNKGNSQHRLYKKSRKIILDLYGIDINNGDMSSLSYVYVDDCMFSGSTVLNDMKRLIEEIPNNSEINAIFIIIHSFAEWWVKQNLSALLKEKNIRFNIWRIKTVENSGGKNHSYECLWPQCYESDNVTSYLESIQREHEATPDKKVRLFRDDCYCGGEYSSETNRIILERELMEAGIKIIGFSANPKQYIRPMGYDNRISFGFGAFFATYLNMSNNCPLAFWWGDPNASPFNPLSKWYPLLPRKSNDNVGDLIV